MTVLDRVPQIRAVLANMKNSIIYRESNPKLNGLQPIIGVGKVKNIKNVDY